ncbi:MAG: septal ring lytic transglycosylase RlpA family protein [Thiogranum sp.]
MKTPQLIVLNLILLILVFVINVRVQAETVMDVKTGKSVEVVINDRGPHINNRIIDLSGAAARGIDLIEDGHGKVKLEVYEP